MEIEIDRLALRPRAVNLARVLVNRAVISSMHRIHDQAELGIIERHRGHRNPVSALVHAIECRRQVSVLGRSHVQDKPKLRTPSAQRSLPIAGQLRLRTARGSQHRSQTCEQMPNYES